VHAASRSDATPWFVAALLCSVVGGVVLEARPASAETKLWASLAVQGLWVCLAAGLAQRFGAGGVAVRLGLGPGRLGVPACLALIVGFVAFSNALSALLVLGELRDRGSLAEIDAMLGAVRGPGLLLALVALGIAPGIGEELLFRGFVQRSVTARLGSAAGIAAGALAFGLAHFDPVHSGAAALLGVYLGVVAHLAGSTRLAMACHVANNSLGVLAGELGPASLPVDARLWIGGLLAAAVALPGAAARGARRRLPAGRGE
jgi:membrane protease YdiL (CAAX protease family)